MNRKVFLSLLAILIFYTAGALVSVRYLTDTTRELNRIIKMHEVEELRKSLVINVQAVQNDLYTVNTPLTSNIDFIVDNMIKLEKSAGVCTTCHHAPGMKERLIDIQNRIDEYGDALSYYLTGSANSERIIMLRKSAAEIGDRVLLLTSDMSHKASAKIDTITNSASRRLKEIRMIILITLVTTFSISVVIAFRLKGFIVRPVKELVNATRRITSGDYDVNVSCKDRTEFGELAKHFNTMSASIKEGYEKINREMAFRKQTEEALVKSERFLNSMFDSIHDPFCIIDSEYRLIRANEAYVATRRLTGTDFMGRHCYEALHGRNSVCGGCVVEKSFRSKDPCAKEKLLTVDGGTKIWLEIYTYPVFNKDGGVSHVIEYSRDISDRKHTEEARKAAEEQIIFNSLHDSLTGLPNRVLFFDHLRHAMDRGKRQEDYLFAVLFLDIDRFKVFNDSLGHSMGDVALTEISRRLKESVRSHDVIARFGGDEFVILLDNLKSREEAVPVTEHLQGNIARPFEISGREIFTSASVGIAFCARDCEKPEHYLRDADIAMYYAKGRGHGHYEIFNKKMYASALARVQLETDLRQAIKLNEFRLHYQPIISMETGAVCGFEALVRWQHPERGLISPAEFIGLAEETGLIIHIGEWVLNEACRQMRIWREKFAGRPPLTMSVNISSRQLFPNLVTLVGRVTEQYAPAPGSLVLEITESMLMENAVTVLPLLSKLKEMQVQIHIDDFGTGYSSLSYLHQLPIDALKIDRSFIRMTGKKDNHVIARAVATLAHGLNMEVVAEGVETEEQLALVKSLKCEYVQGFLISKPLEAGAAEALLREDRRVPA
ncbi:MAG: EAL domain-containing protein [Nitrospiraceae bacterium]|nr:MAG: EAL domain-containing protein [Nitrospiraceae bacterium]